MREDEAYLGRVIVAGRLAGGAIGPWVSPRMPGDQVGRSSKEFVAAEAGSVLQRRQRAAAFLRPVITKPLSALVIAVYSHWARCSRL